MKTQNQLRKKAGEMKEPLVEFFRKHLTSAYGDEVEQLRVVGYLCQMMMEMVEVELATIKLMDEHEKPKRIMVAVH